MPSRAPRFVIRKKGDAYSWELVVRGEAVARSAKRFHNKTNVRRSIDSVSRHIGAAPVIEDVE